MPLTISAVPVPVAGEGRSPLIDADAEVRHRADLDLFGHDDLHDSAQVAAINYTEQAYTRKAWLVAQRNGAGPVIASARLAFPQRDNRTLAMMAITVDPDEDIAEVGDELWRDVERVIRAEGRAVVQCWSPHRFPAPGAATLSAPASGAAVPDDAQSRAFLRWGFRLEQCERHSVLDLVRSRAGFAGLLAAAEAKASEYDTVSWFGRTPPEHVEAMAALRARMSVDVPSADLDLEEEVWDADRVRELDARIERLGRRQLATVAVHRTTGQLAAYTTLENSAEHPQVAYQEDTLVHGAHRGRRLGMLIKVRNAMRLTDELPSVRRVHTWNAEENAHMLAVNVAMGFEPASVEAAWQARLT